MVKKRFMVGMKNLALVLGIMVLGACATARYIVLEEPLKPDNKSALVIFFGRSFSKAMIWDGEKPIGTFEGTPMSTVNCIYWKTTPGTHIFVGKALNYVDKKMNLQANKTYYIKVVDVPSPVPYTTMVAMTEATKKEYDDYLDDWKKLGNSLTHMEYDNTWREEILAENNGRRLNDMREHLKDVK